jgi:glycosyltransferase involved in cell wall biosynthesis
MTSPLRISAVIPCYNGAKFLPDAIHSVLTQTRPVHEVIVVDDGSSDGSAAIAREMGAKCIQLPGNSGPSAARNRGIREADGDVIAFLDADDFWMSMHCAEVVSLLDRHPECSVAFSRTFTFGEEESVSPVYLAADTPTAAIWPLLRENMVKQSAAVVRRSALVEHGGYDESRWYSEDYDLWLRLARHAPFVGTNVVTSNHRVHPGQLSRDQTRILLAGWDIRFQFWANAIVNESWDFITRLDALLLELWNTSLTSAWWTRDENIFLTALGMHEKVPNSTNVYRRWLRRYRLSWSGWLALSRVWERLPRRPKDFARPRLRALLQPPTAGLV